MELNVRNDSRIVEIWLTKAEKQDERVQRELKLVYQSFKGTGYTVATFLSGDQNLTDTTSGLCEQGNRNCFCAVPLYFSCPFPKEPV